MIGEWQAGGEDQALRRDPRVARRAPEVVPHRVAAVAQPEHRIRAAFQDAHPGAEHRRFDLVAGVEAAQHRHAFRQAVITLSASARVRTNGFSMYRCAPARRQASATSACWSACRIAIDTNCGLSRSSISRQSA
jgi:hypothetical protein